MQPLRLAVLLSGSGRTLDNLLERIASGHLAACGWPPS
jgi:folate-dependent phosphoribosylglycinamide formyltransferase PurN